MTDSRKLTIKSMWKKMAEADMGYLVSPQANAIYRFFENLFNSESLDGMMSCHIDEDIAYWLRSYQAEVHPRQEDFYMVMCCDLHSIEMSEYCAKDFQWWLLYKYPYSGAKFNWLWHYQMLEMGKI